MGTLGQSPPNYVPEFTQLVDGSNIEHVRKGPEGLVGNDGVTDRALWGYQKGGFEDGDDFGFKISKKGVRVQDATDDQLIMSSAFDNFKILDSGTKPITVSVGSGAFFIPHPLGFAPVFIAYITNVGGTTYTPLPFMQVGATSVGTDTFGLGLLIDATSSATDILIRSACTDAAYAGDYTIKYYLLAETAN